MRRISRYLLLAVGAVSLALGVTGIFVPLLPTTPLLLLSAACFLRSSERLHSWLVEHRVLGKYVRGFLEGGGMRARSKRNAVTMIWGSLGLSSAILLWTREADAVAIAVVALLALNGGAVHWYIMRRVPTTADAEDRVATSEDRVAT